MRALELVSKELNHLAAILHVYAGGLNENGNTFTLLIIFIVKSLQKEQNTQIYYYNPQSAGINLQSPQSDSTPWTLILYPTVSRYHQRKKNMIDFRPLEFCDGSKNHCSF